MIQNLGFRNLLRKRTHQSASSTWNGIWNKYMIIPKLPLLIVHGSLCDICVIIYKDMVWDVSRKMDVCVIPQKLPPAFHLFTQPLTWDSSVHVHIPLICIHSCWHLLIYRFKSLWIARLGLVCVDQTLEVCFGSSSDLIGSKTLISLIFEIWIQEDLIMALLMSFKP